MDENCQEAPTPLAAFIGGQSRESTLTERLTERRQRTEAELARIKEAERLLQSQPGVAEVLNALAKLGVR